MQNELLKMGKVERRQRLHRELRCMRWVKMIHQNALITGGSDVCAPKSENQLFFVLQSALMISIRCKCCTLYIDKVQHTLFYLMRCKKCSRILPEVQTKEY